MPPRHIVLTDHRSNPDLIEADVPPNLNNLIGQIPYARLDPVIHRYVFNREARPGFFAWAKKHHAYVEDRTSWLPDREVGLDANSEIPYARECDAITGWITGIGEDCTEDYPGAIPLRCGAPVPWRDPPNFCRTCGQPKQWRRVEHGDTAVLPKHECLVCHHEQSAREPFCGNCGAGMVYPDYEPRADRAQQSDPTLIGDDVREGSPTSEFRDTMAASGVTVPPDVLDRMAAGLLGPIFGKGDWIAYRAFWATIPQRKLGQRPEIREWDKKGRPATWKEYASASSGGDANDAKGSEAAEDSISRPNSPSVGPSATDSLEGPQIGAEGFE